MKKTKRKKDKNGIDNMDYRYETKEEARDFHRKRIAFVILNNKIEFLPDGSPMSHYEYCKTKGLNKKEFNEITRGYYLNGELISYKDNFIFDDDVIKETLKYLDEISLKVKSNSFNIYFGLLLEENFPPIFYYGKYLNGIIVKNKYKLSDEKLKLYNERQNLINLDSFPNDLTIISNTCIGGRLYHDYHKKFLSPTIDFYMEPSSFVKFCSNLKYYLNCEIKPLPNYKIDYLSNFLFCDIGGLIAAFGHTNDSYEKIINKWNERKKRVNYDNIIVICTDRNVLAKPFTKCTEETVKEFGKIPYKKYYLV